MHLLTLRILRGKGGMQQISLRILTMRLLRLHAPPHPEDPQGRRGHAADEPENPHNEALEASMAACPYFLEIVGMQPTGPRGPPQQGWAH